VTCSTTIHSVHIVLFPLQQWVRECAKLLSCFSFHVACNFCCIESGNVATLRWRTQQQHFNVCKVRRRNTTESGDHLSVCGMNLSRRRPDWLSDNRFLWKKRSVGTGYLLHLVSKLHTFSGMWTLLSLAWSQIELFRTACCTGNVGT
jgi:hypothetical protein